ncbi:hypothetical protein [Mycobacteroides abscessus]|uniref:hypothetical protein n=1 Tax=Mycobacteroides abscessus TaxID=36809 RepID=UPI000C258F6A|nr:hypothetical protein [Mycobacteroides abscessus]
MPAGVEVVVKEGFATIDFVDGTLRGPGLAKLLEVGTPPEAIEKLTREGPRAVYVLPEGNAREAGLLDEVDADDHNDGPPPAGMTDETTGDDGSGAALPLAEPVSTDTEGTAIGDPTQEPLPTGDFAPKPWPEGDPELDWKRPQLDAYAASKGLDTKELPNKEAVFAAIAKHASEAMNS